MRSSRENAVNQSIAEFLKAQAAPSFRFDGTALALTCLGFHLSFAHRLHCRFREDFATYSILLWDFIDIIHSTLCFTGR